jgi:two-component system sensor histidine kinase CreC
MASLSIFVRIWLAFAVVLLVGSALTVNALQHQIKPSVRQVVEDTLADNANMLAAIVANDVVNRQVQTTQFDQRIQAALARPIQAKIWNFQKDRISQHLYITDQHGIVLYDSTGQYLGQDFSRWNDVYLTLHGQYGVRSTRTDPNDDTSSTMYVAAPIVSNGQLIGVLSLSKVGTSVQPFIEQTQRNMLLQAGLVVLLSLLLCGVVAWWLRRSINQVRRYALALAQPDHAVPHFYSASELNDLTRAIGDMRQQLEDRAYVEQYIHTLTHELKSPLTAIRASAELLQDPLPPADQQRFARNIDQQTERLQQLVERLLILARLEQGHDDFVQQPIDLSAFINEGLEHRHSELVSKQIRLSCDYRHSTPVSAEPFWLGQAIGNVLDNAIDFCPQQGQISICTQSMDEQLQIMIENDGPAIPDYALSQVFDRYYSLPRPNGRKSTGIGLTLVHEVMARHHGTVQINNTQHGVRVVLCF